MNKAARLPHIFLEPRIRGLVSGQSAVRGGGVWQAPSADSPGRDRLAARHVGDERGDYG